MKQTQHGGGHTAKHSQSGKHGQGGAKHNPKHPPSRAPQGAKATPPHVIAKQPGQPKPRRLSAGDVACCSAEALAASARLAGSCVAAEDVLALYWRTASDPDAGATIAATLEAAREHGLGKFRPLAAERVGDPAGGRGQGQPVEGSSHRIGGVGSHLLLEPFSPGGIRHAVQAHALILGIELPGGPHALIVDTAGRAWSWGRPWPLAEFADAVVDEAWAVMWP